MKQSYPFIVGFALLTATSPLHAQDFQHQASLGYSYVDYNDGSDDSGNINYSYFFDKVRTDSPYALNAFLAQSSRVDASFATSGSEYNFAAIGGTWVSDTKLFVRGNYGGDIDHFSDNGTLALAIGYYLNANTEIALTYTHAEFNQNYDSETDAWGIEARSWFELPTTLGIDAGIKYQNADSKSRFGSVEYSTETNSASAFADWYLTKSLSLGLNATYIDPEHAGSDTFYAASLDYWLPLGNTFSLQTGAYTELNSDVDAWGINVAVTARF
ncbi:putative porin [Shewanella submarina]|uniref:Porin n=1 Tax=Shewanella submarina TaxID=2016376 RepID=A0ABV7GBK4_9GAMM|nr:putative porin [Shewanella submarina]MCL1038947.1 putative porin [Shewanella submarina]